MAKQMKIGAFLTFGLAVIFMGFFQNSKHLALFANVNPFAEDPYDAVGSFGVQVALLTALLALLRAFRPSLPNQTSENQQQLFLRATSLCCVSIAITLVADIIALFRHIPMWINESAGVLLAAWVGAIVLLIAFVGSFLRRFLFTPSPGAMRHRWFRAISLSLVAILILALYPENWRVSLPGALFTIFVGIAFLFGLTWVLTQALFPNPAPLVEDCIDDFLAIYQWLKDNLGAFRWCFDLLDKVRRWRVVRAVLGWLNPRRHVWVLPLVLGCLMGVGLLVTELLAEQGGVPQIRQLVLVGSIYLGVECVGVLLGYVLLADVLGLFRHVGGKAHG